MSDEETVTVDLPEVAKLRLQVQFGLVEKLQLQAVLLQQKMEQAQKDTDELVRRIQDEETPDGCVAESLNVEAGQLVCRNLPIQEELPGVEPVVEA